MNIQMVDLLGQYNKISKEIDEAIKSVIEDTAFINGPAVKEFAKNFALYNKVRNVIPCANGTDALQIALMALDLEPGDEVILPVHTYVATAEVIALLRLKPVFVDVNPENFNIEPKGIESKISSKTKAIVPVHLYGQCAPMQELLEIADEYNLYIIEDTAQAIGAEYKFPNGSVKKAGTIGTIGATSFFPSKNLGCYGDGGALLTIHDELAEKCRVIANHGQKIKYHHDLIGVNSRLDTIQAAILNVKLKSLAHYTNARQNVARFYDEALSNIDGINTPKVSDFSTHVYHQYTLQVSDNRNDLKEYLNKENIPTMIYYPVPLHLQKAYNNYGYKKGDFPIAEELSETVLSLPIHTELTLNEQEYIVEKIKSFFS